MVIPLKLDEISNLSSSQIYTKQNKTNLKFCSSSQINRKNITLIINQKVTSLVNRGIGTGKDCENYTISIPLTLTKEGINQVQVIFDIDGQKEVKEFEITYQPPSRRKNHLLAIGITDYKHIEKLPNATKDANDIKNILINDYQFENNNITYIKDHQATRNNILNTLRTLATQLKPEDNLLIYYAGHGHLDEILNEGYWIPVDAKNENEYISVADIHTRIRAMKCRNVLLIADACFSGSLLKTNKSNQSNPNDCENVPQYVDNISSFNSRRVLASGRTLETVNDGVAGENSPFAAAIIAYLKKHPCDIFTSISLEQYVKKVVPSNAAQTPVSGVIFNCGDENGEFIFRKK